ncbi:nucleotidyltransferase domain-containing protein [Candidatus Woesearchaeota archaeon]|nr:nucleotidyltransferase domain-containing protein [Candidatus Woesearchaeota archaeon]
MPGKKQTKTKSVAKKATKKATTKVAKMPAKKAVKQSKVSKSTDIKVDQYVPGKSAPIKKDNSKEQTELDKVIEQIPADQKEQLITIRKSLEKFKTKILARLDAYVMGITLLPPEKNEENKDQINALVLIDDEDSNKLPKHELLEKVQKAVDEQAAASDKNLKVQALLLSELWQQCYDSKHDTLQMIAMGATVYDKGMMAAVKISEVHKQMVLNKFEKYIVSYVLSGSLTQGKATPESDIDVFIVIDDTDVKKMTRVELLDKLRSIIIGMGAEAGQMTGIHNKLNVQVYILTDFWENIKDANPVIFTLLRSGVPFYDRGVFMPWKQLLRMGRIKPSPEAIEMFMQSGNQFMDRIHAKLRDIVMEDLFWALLTPSQAALMMCGIPPTTPKETPDAMRNILIKKEKLLEPNYVKTLEKVLHIRKEFEHGNRKHVTGKEVDEIVRESDEYLKRIQKLFEEIDVKKQGEEVVHTYEQMITILRDALRLEGLDSVDEKDVEGLFSTHIVKKGLVPEHTKRLIKELVDAKKKFDSDKLNKQEAGLILRESRELIKLLVDHIQRKRGQELEKTKVRVKYGDNKFGDVILLGDHAFVIHDLDDVDKKITRAKITKLGTLIDKTKISLEELESAIMAVEIPPKVFIKGALFDDLKDIFGEDVEVLVNY